MPSVWLKPWPTEISPAIIGEGPISSSGRLPPKLLKRQGKQRIESFHLASTISSRSRGRGFPPGRQAAGLYLLGEAFFAAALESRRFRV